MREHQPLFLLVATDKVGGGVCVREMEGKDTKRERGQTEGVKGRGKTGREELVTCIC